MAKISRTMSAVEIKKPGGSTFYTTLDCGNAMKSINHDIEITPLIGTFYCTEAEFLSIAKLKQPNRTE